MPERVDDSGDVGVVRDQSRVASTAAVGFERNGVDDPEGAPHAPDLVHFRHHGRFERHGDREAAPGTVSAHLVPDLPHEIGQGGLGHVNGGVGDIHAQVGVRGPVQRGRLRMADGMPEDGRPQRHTQRPGLASHQALYCAT